MVTWLYKKENPFLYSNHDPIVTSTHSINLSTSLPKMSTITTSTSTQTQAIPDRRKAPKRVVIHNPSHEALESGLNTPPSSPSTSTSSHSQLYIPVNRPSDPHKVELEQLPTPPPSRPASPSSFLALPSPLCPPSSPSYDGEMFWNHIENTKTSRMDTWLDEDPKLAPWNAVESFAVSRSARETKDLELDSRSHRYGEDIRTEWIIRYVEMEKEQGYWK